ncbi:hypothetical protein ACFVXQ_15500 [Kitasatospora sp. NPDC058263]
MSAAAASAGQLLRLLRSSGRRRRGLPTGDGDLAALAARHDRVRERYGALLTLDRAGRLAVAPGALVELTDALTRAADLRPGAEGAYTARSAYARAIGELESAWAAIAAQADRQGLFLPDDGGVTKAEFRPGGDHAE